MKAADELAKHVGVKPACAALEVSRSTLYRRRGPSTGQQQPRPTPARALSETERGEVFDTLCSERFVDRSPAEVVATLLDEEVYLCSERTMYRVLASEVPVQERRAQRTHPEYKKPELMATAPNQVWSWDITRLLGPKKWNYYYLYVIMDIYSRYVVGWMVADRENSALAGRLIQQSCLKHGVQPRVLTLHSDRGTPMTSQCTPHPFPHHTGHCSLINPVECPIVVDRFRLSISASSTVAARYRSASLRDTARRRRLVFASSSSPAAYAAALRSS